jgi:predicted HTH domain antitoxin
MCRITLDIPEDSLEALRMTPEKAAVELRLIAAMKLYEVGKLSSGAAAHMAGIPRVDFLQRLADYSVTTFNHTSEELQNETRLA